MFLFENDDYSFYFSFCFLDKMTKIIFFFFLRSKLVNKLPNFDRFEAKIGVGEERRGGIGGAF